MKSVLRFAALIALLCVMIAPTVAIAADDPNAVNAVPIGKPVADLYSYALKLVGLAVFCMFLLAGLGYMVPAIGKAWDPMTLIQNAVIGLIILLSAYVILASIHPDLVGGSPASSTTKP